MTITFRIATAADYDDGPVAEISARQLTAFCSLLREEGRRHGSPLMDLADGEEALNLSSFEVRVCPIALATMAPIFDLDPAVIADWTRPSFVVAAWRSGGRESTERSTCGPR